MKFVSKYHKVTDVPVVDLEVFDTDNAKPNAKWSIEDRILAVAYYAICASSYKTAELLKTHHGLDVPASTIRAWKVRTNWWKPVMEDIRRAKQEELDSKLTAIIHKATEQLEDRVENGNFKHNPKTGEIERIPLNTAELSTHGLAIPYDKRALGRGEATARREVISSEAKMEALARRFEEMTKTITAQKVPSTVYAIEGESDVDDAEYIDDA